jgi:AcrR family transcriptional regulator
VVVSVVEVGPGDVDRSTRARLLDASFELLVRDGYQATTVKAVADRAGLTTGAIYANFVNKQELFGAALLDRWIEAHHRLLDSAAERGPSSTGPLLAHFVAHFAAEPSPEHQLLTEVTGALMREADPGSSPLRRGVAMLEEAVRVTVERGKAAGLVSPDLDTDALVYVLVTLHLGTITSKSFGMPQLPAARAEEALRAFARGIARGSPPAGGAG